MGSFWLTLYRLTYPLALRSIPWPAAFCAQRWAGKHADRHRFLDTYRMATPRQRQQICSALVDASRVSLKQENAQRG